MERVRIYQLLVLFALLLGYFGCGLALQRGVGVPAILYWALFLAIPCVSILYVSRNESSNALVILMVSISVFSMNFLQNHTWYPSGRDTQYEIQISSLIFQTGKWYPGMGTAMATELSVHPAMHIFTASFSLVSGINPFQVMFFIPWLKAMGFALFFYLFARSYLSEEKGLFPASSAFFASIVYLGCIWHVGYPHRETFAEILFMGALWLYTRKETGSELKTVFILLTFSLAMSHHFTSYIFLLLIAAIYFFGNRRKMVSPLLPALCILSWMMFVSWEIAVGYGMGAFEAFRQVVTLRFGQTPASTALAAMSYYYTPFENLLIFLNPVLIGVLALPSFLNEMQSRRKNYLLAITLVLGVMLIGGVFFLLFRTGMGTSAYRVWGFAYIPLSIWVTLSFWCARIWEKFRNLRPRTIISIAIIIILFSSMNLSLIHGIKKWYVPRGYMETYRFSDSMVSTARWCNVHLNGSIIGDNLAYNSVGSWGYKEVHQWSFNRWYQTKDNEILRKFDYMILSPWDPVTYSDTFREPIDPFALLPEVLSMVYSSGDLIVYRISSQPTAL